MIAARFHQDALTHIELIWHEQQIEHWIRFGRDVAEQILDRRRRILSFAPNSIVAYVRWAAGDFGTIVSRIDILRTVRRGEALLDRSLCAARRRDPTARFRLAEGRARAAGDRCRRADRHRRRRRLSRSLAACSQPARGRASTAPLQPRGSIELGSCAGRSTHDALGWIMMTCFAVALRRAMMLFQPAPKLIWNASASVPIGLYAVHPIGVLHVGELVVVTPPEAHCVIPRHARLSREGRADPEACPRPSWSIRLPNRSHDHRRGG